MRLIKCYIENFGKLSCFETEFNAGLNCFLKDNSWGKSTLAAFIKAMFYGLPQSRVSDLNKNERKKYAPWSGKTFGGSLTFEYSGRIYCIERTFSKGKDDFYRLTDVEKGTECNDLGEDPGYTVFGVNSAAFEKSAFVCLDSSSGKDDSGTKSISAKLNGIIDPDDINNYNNAVKALDERRKYYSVTKGGGVIGECQRRIADYKEDLEKRELTRGLLDSEQAQLLEQRRRVTEYRQRAAYLDTQIKNQTKKRERTRILQQHQSIKGRLNTLSPEYNALSLYFKKGVPDMRQIDECARKIARFDTYESDIARAKDPICTRAVEEKKYFSSYLPTLDEVYTLRDDYRDARTLLEKVPVFDSEDEAALKALEGYAYPDDEELESYEKDRERLVSLSASVDILTEELSAAEQSRSAPKKKRALLPAMLILSAVLIFAGVLLALAVSKALPGVILALAGALLLAVCGFVYFKEYINSRLASRDGSTDTYRQKLSLQQSELSVITEKCALFNTKYSIDMQRGEGGQTVRERVRLYSRLSHERSECEKAKRNAVIAIEEAEQAVKRLYLRMEHSELTVSELDSLIKRLEWYYENTERAESILDDAAVAAAELERATAQVEGFIALYPAVGKDSLERLSDIRSKAQRYEIVSESYFNTARELEDFEKKNPECTDISANTLNQASDGDDVSDIEALDDELERTRALLTSGEKSLSALEISCDNLALQIESKSDLEELIQQESALLELYQKKAKAIDTTKELLFNAKENLSGRYLGQMKDKFSYYLKILSDSDLIEGGLNTELAITLRGEGIMRSMDCFSTGTKAMLSLALHLALSDVLFDRENSFIILDDPFSDLDDTRLEKALGLLKELAKERQIIYFTCCSSRAL